MPFLMPLWNHPLLVSAIMLQDHLNRDREYSAGTLQADSDHVQRTLLADYEEIRKILGGSEEQRAKMISGLNHMLTRAIDTRLAWSWSLRFAAFLLRVLGETKEVRNERDCKNHRYMKDVIRNFESSAAGQQVKNEAIISKLEVQLSIVSTLQRNQSTPLTNNSARKRHITHR